VTGIVENPSDLSDQFVLVSPSGAGPPQSVTVLLNASPASFGAFRTGFRGPLEWQARGASTQGKVAAVAPRTGHGLAAAGPPGAAAASPLSPRAASASSACSPPSGRPASSFGWSWLAAGAVVGVIAAAAGTVVGLAAWIATAPGLTGSLTTGSTGSRSRGT
jgi:putative ABC transport system permease protein